MKRAPGAVSIHQASGSEVGELGEFVLRIVESDSSDPYLASFLHELSEGHSPAERFVEYAVRVEGELAARCEINFQPQPGDINAYGHDAAQLYASERIATLAGDLVSPDFRGLGLQSEMIGFRLALLSDLNYSYVMCGILVGNDFSRDNCRRFGFAQIGEKDIDWGENAVGDRIRRVVLYGLRLSGYDSR